MTGTTERIRWESTDFGGFTGHVGTEEIEVFRLWQNDDAEWVLAADLPGESKYDPLDPEPLKADAERWLAEFVSSLGAVFPDEQAGPLSVVPMVCTACRKPVYQEPSWTAAGPGTATRLWSHESSGDWQACPRYGSGVPVTAISPATPAPVAGEKE